MDVREVLEDVLIDNAGCRISPADLAGVQLAALAAAGYAVVPVEPTEEMVKAGNGQLWCDARPSPIREVWPAMLAAAPKP